jgi:hypothetical protein
MIADSGQRAGSVRACSEQPWADAEHSGRTVGDANALRPTMAPCSARLTISRAADAVLVYAGIEPSRLLGILQQLVHVEAIERPIDQS